MDTKTFEVISPINDEIIHKQSYSSQQEIANALERTSNWAQLSLEKRIDHLSNFLALFEKKKDQIANDICLQMGRPLQQAYGEVKGVLERANYLLSIALTQLSDEIIEQKHILRRYPLGKVFVIAPWNYPYLTAINSIIPALLCGNEVILKHASQTPLCGKLLEDTMREAGVPNEAFQTLYLTHEQTSTLLNHNATQFVSFTGSPSAGYQIQADLKQRFIRRSFELGGKDPAIVLADHDIDSTIENLVDGAFFNSGQSCCGVERIYVDKTCFSQFVEAFVSLTKQYRLGDPREASTNLGPMVNRKASQHVRAQIQQAVEMGAQALLNEQDFPFSKQGSPYLAPQVLIDVDHKMNVMQEESFGPVVGIMPFNNIEEAIALANDSHYGLTASIWTKNLDHAVEIGDKIQTGTVMINRCDYLHPALPWSGVKETGEGLSLSYLSFNQFSRVKAFNLGK